MDISEILLLAAAIVFVIGAYLSPTVAGKLYGAGLALFAAAFLADRL